MLKFMYTRDKYINQVYERLTITDFIKKTDHSDYIVECRCSCGNLIQTRLSSITNGLTRSCGCLRNELFAKALQMQLVEGTSLCNLKRGIQRNNTSGVKGVYYDKNRQKYRAYIGYQGKQYKLGYFDTLEEAACVRKNAEEILYKPILEKYEKG